MGGGETFEARRASLQRKLGRRELKGTFLIDDQDDIERHRLDNIGIVRGDEF